jgi:hypothetical protein
MLNTVRIEADFSNVIAVEKIERLSFPARPGGLNEKPNPREKLGAASRRLVAVPFANLIIPRSETYDLIFQRIAMINIAFL